MLFLAIRNLTAHPVRNALTAFSVMLAMLLVTFVVGAQLRAQQMLTLLKGRNNLLVMAKGDDMPLSYERKVDAFPAVKRSMYMYVVTSRSADKRFQFPLHATTADYATISDSWFYVAPSDLQRWEGERDGFVAAKQTARDLDLYVGKHITLDTDLGPLPLVVSAISEKGYKNTGGMVHYAYFAELFKKQDRVNVLWAELQPNADLHSVTREIDGTFKDTASPTLSISASGNLKSWAQAGRVIPSLLTGAGLIILFATLLVTANTISIGIRERVPELATLRAMGFRRSKILSLLIAEVMTICLMGGLVGGLLPLALFRQGVALGVGQLTVGKVELPPELLIWVLVLSAGLALVAGFVPAWRASRLDVATSLRAQA